MHCETSREGGEEGGPVRPGDEHGVGLGDEGGVPAVGSKGVVETLEDAANKPVILVDSENVYAIPGLGKLCEEGAHKLYGVGDVHKGLSEVFHCVTEVFLHKWLVGVPHSC